MAKERTCFYIDPYYIGLAKAVYKRGAYAQASNSKFLGALLENVVKLAKKEVKK